MTPLLESPRTDATLVALPAAVERPRSPAVVAPALRVLTDERLARLASQGDRAAFGVVFDRYHQHLYRYCLSLLHDREDAADALQSTMLRALRALEGETREIALRPWLYRIAHNESIDLMRRRPPRSEGTEGMHAAIGWDVEAGAEARARVQQLLLDLRELPARQRGALVMREMAGLDYEQIGAALETSAAGAKQAVYEARRALYELAKGRDMDCEGVRSRLSDGDRRSMRARAVRAHLRACSECRDFHEVTAARRSALGSLIPGLPAAAAADVVRAALAGGASGGVGSAGGASVLAGVAATAGVKSLAALTILAAAAGAVQTVTVSRGHERAATSAAQPAAPVRAAARPAPATAAAKSQSKRATPKPVARPSRHAHGHLGSGRHAAAGPGRRPEAAGAGQPDRPSASQPAPAAGSRGHPWRVRPSRPGGSSGGGSGPLSTATQQVVPQVQSDVQQVRETVGSTVTTVTNAVPVHAALPALPKRRAR
jgi:RNA polymerase sigma factor (sigma-70 family)